MKPSKSIAVLTCVSLLFDIGSGFSFLSKRLSYFQKKRMRQKTIRMGDASFSITILGDLHLDPDDMECHYAGREHIKRLTSYEKNNWLVSLGDLGSYPNAGTTSNFEFAKEYLEGFDCPFELVTGNHDLEGMDEFLTDEDNLNAWMKCFGKDKPQFCVQVAEKTILVGMSTVRFRDAPYSSHEVYVDPAQVSWFEDTLKNHPASEGWNVIVFTHAPPVGSNLRVVQNVHIKSGCAWINHSSSVKERNVFREACESYPQIKAWFSGHFHLSHDYEDSISVAAGVAFVQVNVIGPMSSRDGRRQSRFVRGNADGLQIFTINHHRGGDLRLDATIRYDEERSIIEAHEHEDYDHDGWFSAYTPQEEDGCYIDSPDGLVDVDLESGDLRKVCWWHMEDGAVLGVHDGMVVEYDPKMLAPVGVVVDKQALQNRNVMVVEGGKALLLIPNEEGEEPEIIHPNQDGSYWRKSRNTLVRLQEKKREEMVKLYMEKKTKSITKQ